MHLSEAKDIVMEGKQQGVTCPCCEQFCKVYKRRLSSSMARALLHVAKMTMRDPKAPEWLHVHRILTEQKLGGSNDFALLRHWGLVQEKPLDPMVDTGRTSGMWKVTQRGMDFAYNRAMVPSHVFIYNNKVEGFSVEQFGISDALGKKFNYQELMYEKRSFYS